ncbi:MAG: hypothetical protein LBS43_03325 [Prevotellaceae bacterium]|jgi:ribosomal protein S27E|nr:hypothetical protein [Prevotellaceae bacterium]
MGKIAHLKVICPKCNKWTSVYVEETDASSANVKCEHCNKTFVFGAGMMYDPIGYVSEIPSWARIISDNVETKKKWWQFYKS